MFRNIYIEAYKNVIRDNSSLEVMMCHANHLYSAMGCILQDIEFMVANMIQSKNKQGDRQRFSLNDKVEPLAVPKVEFLPSSSIKYDYAIPDYSRSNPQNSRNNMRQKPVAPKNEELTPADSFEEMFSKPKKQPVFEPENNSRSKPQPQGGGGRAQDAQSENSQEDFMEYLFRKSK